VGRRVAIFVFTAVCVAGMLAAQARATPDPAAWRQGLTKGDVLLSRNLESLGALGYRGYYWTHAGIYDGEGYVIEATLKTGVARVPVSTWDSPAKTDVAILRVCTATEAQIARALAFARKQADNRRPYQDWRLFWDYSASSEEAWYCSELVWAAYLNAGIDLVPAPGTLGITPTDIVECPLGTIVGSHRSAPST
jgi:uncharacterized protein YycO